jgi:hypothetical protein
MERTDLAQDKDRWRALVNTVMYLRVPWHIGKFLNNWATGSFWRTQLHGVSQSAKQKQITLTHGAEPFLRSRQLCSYSRTSQHFMEPEGWTVCNVSLGFALLELLSRRFATPLANFLSFLLSSLRDVSLRGFPSLPVLFPTSVPCSTFSLSFSGRHLKRLVGSPPSTKFWFGYLCSKFLNYVSA